MREVLAAHAALQAFAAARSAARPEAAIDVALARYRAFFPLAGRQEVRDVLAHMLALERLQARALALDIRSGRFGNAADERPYRM